MQRRRAAPVPLFIRIRSYRYDLTRVRGYLEPRAQLLTIIRFSLRFFYHHGRASEEELRRNRVVRDDQRDASGKRIDVNGAKTDITSKTNSRREFSRS